MEKELIKSLVVILSTSTVAALVFQRLKLALIPAYLVAGVFAGPFGLGLVPESGVLQEIGHLAVVLLLFSVGMELHLSSFKRDAWPMLGTALGSCCITILVGVLLISGFGLALPQALVIAMGLSLSSTAVVLRLLASSRQLVRGHGQLSLAVLVSQDLLVLFMIAIIPLLASYAANDSFATNGSLSSTGLNGLLTATGLVALFVGGQKLLPRLLKEAIRNRSSEALVLVAVSFVLVAAVITEKLGFSMEMGAFLVGFLLASSPFRYQLSTLVTPLRDLFMAVFFTTLGMELDVGIVYDYLPLVVGATALLLLVKTFTIGLAAWLFGVHGRIAVLCGIILCQAGEFSLIVFGRAEAAGLLNSEQLSIIAGMVILSLIVTPTLFSLTPFFATLGNKLPAAPWVSKAAFSEKEGELLSATGEHVIVAGYGPVGREACAVLEASGVCFTVVEMNLSTVQREKAKGLKIIYGDIASESILHAARAENAKAILLTFPDAEKAIETAQVARGMNPDVEIVARATSAQERYRLEATDIDDAVVDEELSAKAMVEFAQQLTRVH